jgi:peptidoglycan-associated lipoprotein
MNSRSRIPGLILGVLGLVMLAGCSRSTTLPDAPAGADGSAGGMEGSSTMDGASTMAAGAGAGLDGAAERAQDALLSRLVVYFDYDRSEIRTEFNDLLAAHAAYLATRPSMQVRLEGHTDERGSREYNIGLGEQRAQAVRRVLMLQGAAADQVTTVSYGEERPAAFGSDEESYGLNRRVELVYRQ